MTGEATAAVSVGLVGAGWVRTISRAAGAGGVTFSNSNDVVKGCVSSPGARSWSTAWGNETGVGSGAVRGVATVGGKAGSEVWEIPWNNFGEVGDDSGDDSRECDPSWPVQSGGRFRSLGAHCCHGAGTQG